MKYLHFCMTRPGCVLLAVFALALEVPAAQPAPAPALANRSPEQLLTQAIEATTIIERSRLSEALAAKGVAVIPQLRDALAHPVWQLRHCALLALKDLARTESNRPSLVPLVPPLGLLVAADAHHGVRRAAAECLGTLGQAGKPAQQALAKAAVDDDEPWVRAATAAALAAVQADVEVMLPVYEAMIRSSDKASRAAGISEANKLLDKRVDISSLVPALKDVFLHPIYDANFSSQTRVPALGLLLKLKVDIRELVPAILKDLASTGLVQADGYHPYLRMTLKLLGQLGAQGGEAIPMLEQVVADPSKFGCTPSHPDYKGFIADAQASIQQIRKADSK